MCVEMHIQLHTCMAVVLRVSELSQLRFKPPQHPWVLFGGMEPRV